MPRYRQEDGQENSSYGQFFQPAINQVLTNAERERLLREAITDAENYQNQINIRQERKEKIEALLNKGNLSLAAREKAVINIQFLNTEVEYHQANLARLIASSPALQAHFAQHRP